MDRTDGIDVCYCCGGMKKTDKSFSYNEIKCSECNDKLFDNDSKLTSIGLKLVRMRNKIIENNKNGISVNDIKIIDDILWKYYMVRLIYPKDMEQVNLIYKKYLK